MVFEVRQQAEEVSSTVPLTKAFYVTQGFSGGPWVEEFYDGTARAWLWKACETNPIVQLHRLG